MGEVTTLAAFLERYNLQRYLPLLSSADNVKIVEDVNEVGLTSRHEWYITPLRHACDVVDTCVWCWHDDAGFVKVNTDTSVISCNIPSLSRIKNKTTRSIALDDSGSEKCFIAGILAIDTSGTIIPIDIWIYNGISMNQACGSTRTLLLMQLNNGIAGTKQQKRAANGWTLVTFKDPEDMTTMHVKVYTNGTLVEVTVDTDLGLLYNGIKMKNFAFMYSDYVPTEPGEKLMVHLSQGHGCILVKRHTSQRLADVSKRTKKGLPTVTGGGATTTNNDTNKDDEEQQDQPSRKRKLPTTIPNNQPHSSALTTGINETVRQAFAAVCPPDKNYDWLTEQTLPEFYNAYLKTTMPYRADVYCPQLSVMVEYNGAFHYRKGYMERTVNDIMKL
ncbi:hypothetical protein MRX96_031901 [Rhipicephalus microplus]